MDRPRLPGESRLIRVIGRLSLLALLLAVIGWSSSVTSAQTGKLTLDFIDQKTKEPFPSRIQLLNSKQRPVRMRRTLTRNGWLLLDGPLEYSGRTGDYTYRLAHGYEYAPAGGGFTLDRNSDSYEPVEVPRHANMAEEGWYGGDLGSRVPSAETLEWLAAEGLLTSASLLSQFNAEHKLELTTTEESERFVSDGYIDERPVSRLALHHWHPPAKVPSDLPSCRLLAVAKSSSKADEASSKKLAVHAELQSLWVRDLPLLLASEQVDSVQVLGNHLSHDGEGVTAKHYRKPPVIPEGFYRNPKKDPGRIIERIYWQMLEAGLRIPPSAGSGFGNTNNMLGYSRVYVQGTKSDLSASAWWKSLREGRSFVTSGPLLRVSINGQPPGSTFENINGSVDLNIGLTLTVADPVDYLDVIFNGNTLYQARLDEYAKAGGRIPLQTVEESGWLVVRVITAREFTYRVASTAPFYVEIDNTKRVSRGAVEFFQQWLSKTVRDIEKDADSLKAQQPYIDRAREFWNRQLEIANAD